jgi:hypothetical protein
VGGDSGILAVQGAPLATEQRRSVLDSGLDVLTPSPILPLQGHTPTTAAAEPGGMAAGPSTTEAGPSGGSLPAGDEESGGLRNLICSYSWDCDTALAIVYGPTTACSTGESNGDPAAISWNGTSYGLFQIWRGHAWRWPNWGEWANPEVNTAWAYELWLEQGWWPWGCW